MTAAKSLRQRGIDFDWFEKGPALGGLWRYDNDSGASSTYRSPQIDTSSRSLAYPDFPVPREWPAYVRALQVLEHLERYAAAFGVADAVRHLDRGHLGGAVRRSVVRRHRPSCHRPLSR